MKKRLSVVLLALLLLALLAATAQGQTELPEQCQDNNNDNLCDAPGCQDRDGDGRCDQAEQGTDKARSACSFSGFNDNPNDPTGDVFKGQTQNYGQLVRQGEFGPFTSGPGIGCNPNKGGEINTPPGHQE